MGNCLQYRTSGRPNLSRLSVAESEAHQSIQEGLNRAIASEKRTKKLLLLGTGSSGKSTLFKQIKYIHGSDFTHTEFVEALHVMRANIVLSIMKLIFEAGRLCRDGTIDENIDSKSPETNEALQLIFSYKNDTFEVLDGREFDWDDMTRLATAIEHIWNLEVIQKTFAHRERFAMPENMDHFMAKVTAIFGDEYFPDRDDVLRARMRSAGIIDTEYELKDVVFHIFDVGGQRNERKKWIHLFEDVTAIIFVSALNHYNRVLFEDETKNAMHESLALFNEIIMSKWFRRTEIILFLNKKDLFAECIREGASLSNCFSADRGWDGTQWDDEKDHSYRPIEVHDDSDREINHNLFEKSYRAALEFITNIYLSYNRNPVAPKMIFVHVTDATDRQNINRVFMDVQKMVVGSQLKRGGFI